MTQLLSFIPVKIIYPSIEIPKLNLCQGAIAQVHQHREVLQLHHSADPMADLLQQLLGCWSQMPRPWCWNMISTPTFAQKMKKTPGVCRFLDTSTMVSIYGLVRF